MAWTKVRRQLSGVPPQSSLAHARFVLADWREDYNHVRPHSKLGGLTPADIAGQPVWGHASRPVAIPSIKHREGARLYS
ncbi:integrase core domain-containing protein [Rhizorhabdus sp. FW153]|uniref:integrase core domain-containing protein n=1 Tax=Rhizorhabdus sp. FW153 TaxID=3400216 RepID=UPI003CF75FD5